MTDDHNIWIDVRPTDIKSTPPWVINERPHLVGGLTELRGGASETELAAVAEYQARVPLLERRMAGYE